MVLPKAPPKQLGSCLTASTRAIDNHSTETVEIGGAQFIASRRGKDLTMTVAFKDRLNALQAQKRSFEAL